MLVLFYHAFIESVLSFALVAWFANLTLQDKNALGQIVKWAGRLIGEPQLTLTDLYEARLQRKASTIVLDSSHPLHSEFQLLPSSCRFTVPKARTKRYRTNLCPSSYHKAQCQGKRVCLGESLAKMELFLFLVGLLQKFSFSVPDGVELSTEGITGTTRVPLPFKVSAKIR